ncbi:MAG: oligosaccharide flippase family protein [Chitinivibrionales bacterium]|nr:oligosaccharide flippase family protein [Chitinivibrionales bacterium]
MTAQTAPTLGSRLIKNSVLNLFNTFFNLATTWVISIWVARQLGPDRYGIFNLVLWVTGTFTWVIGMGLIHAVTKFIAECNGKGQPAQCVPIIFFIFKIELAFSLLVTIICCFFKTAIAAYFFTPHESFYFLLAFIGLLPGVVTAIFSATIEGIQKFEYFTLGNLIISPLSFMSKAAVLWMGMGINGLLIVMLFFSFVNSIFYYYVLKREGLGFSHQSKHLEESLKKRIYKYNASVMAILICDKIVWDKSENFFLGRLCRSTEIAYYNLGFNVAQRLMSVLPQTFWKVLFPAMAHFFGAGDGEKTRRLFFICTRYLAFFSFPVGIGGAILSFPLIRYMYGSAYIGAQHALQIIFISSIISSLANPASAILYGYEKQGFIYKYGAVLAVVNIVLDILLIKPYGALGAAWCYAITTLLASVGGLLYTCRTMKLSYPFVSLFKIVFSTIIMGIVMELIILRAPNLFGYLAALISGGFVYCVAALILGTFEDEDYALLESVKKVLPGKSKRIIANLIDFIAQFKNSRPGHA